MGTELLLVLSAFGVGIVIGLTGMGGGALMTPMLVIFFGIPPLAAVSSDLVATAVMKPFGAGVHLRRGTVDLPLVGWLCVGSVPSAFLGVLLARSLGDGQDVQDLIQIALGVALLLAVAGLAARAYVRLRERVNGTAVSDEDVPARVQVRRLPTVLVGAVGGLVVGVTSVGSGSLIIVALLALYPMLKMNKLVGTDLTQAVPLVAAAALGHLLLGDFQLDIAAGILIGGIPGVLVGAAVSSRVNGRLVRWALVYVLLASALKLLGVGNVELGVALLAAFVAGPLVWALVRRRHGLPLTFAAERRAQRAAQPDATAEKADDTSR